MLLYFVSFLLVLGGTVVLLIWAVRRFGTNPQSRSDDPVEILRARYARGEIGRDEFERIRDDLDRRASTGEGLSR